jgi:hypothetical protein
MGDYLPGVPLSRKLSKKYAQCKRTFELGIWGHDLNIIKGVYLTTWSEAKQSQGKFKGTSKNDWRFLVEDLRELRRRLNKLGIKHESCFVPEKSPGRGLLHLHGFIRLERPMSSAELHRIISEIWGKIHDSPVVWVKDLYSLDGAMKYVLKDAVKNYLSAEIFGGKRLMSRGWLPAGSKQVQKVLVRWYLEHKYPLWVQDEEDIYDFEKNRNADSQDWDYVYMAKEIMNDLLRRWCNGEAIRLEFRGGCTYIQGTNIYEMMD